MTQKCIQRFQESLLEHTGSTVGVFIKSCGTKAVCNIWWAMCVRTRLSIMGQYCLRVGLFALYCVLAEIEKMPWGWMSYF